jgi:hypothetical protein
MDFFKIHGPRWTSIGFKNEEQALINLIHVQKRLLEEHSDIIRRLE